jgi:hypothetical protein
MNKDKMPAQPYNSVFIIALTQNMNVRSSLENELAAAAQSNGIKATRSLAVFTPVTGVPDSVVTAALVKTIKASGSEGILVVTLLDSKSETKYTPGSSYSYDPFHSTYGYYGMFYDYYNHYNQTYNQIDVPGYYTTNETYYLETNFFDVATQANLFSVQTKAYNPHDMDNGSKKFTETLIDELKRNGLLKKRK